MRSALLFAASTALAAAQPYHRADSLRFPSPLDGAEVPYTFYSPRAIEPGRRYPLLIGLHGTGQNERLMMRRIFGRGNLPGESDLEASRVVPPLPDIDFFVACPFARMPNYWSGFLEREVLALIEKLTAEHSIDPARVYLTGIAEGAGGALAIALRHPGRFAAVAGVAPMLPPGGLPEDGAITVRLLQGALDPRVPAEQTRALAETLRARGAAVEYTEYPAAKHNAWDTAYARAGLFGWLTQRSAGTRADASDALLAEAFATRHLYVYSEGRRQDAERAAQWTRTIRLEVRADDQVTVADRATSNLILFGTKEDNREIARIAAELPLELSPSAADYGLLFAVRRDGRIAAVSSGLPWWPRSGAEPWRAVPASDDFVLFKGTADNVVVRGRFDAQGQISWDVATQLAENPSLRAAVRAFRIAPPPAPAKPVKKSQVTKGGRGASTPSSRAVPSGQSGNRSSPRLPATTPSPRPPAKNE